MEAARTAAARGHAVTLFGMDRLGGNLNYAAGLPFKGDMKRYLQWLVKQTGQAEGVTVKLNCEATAEAVKAEQPDVVIGPPVRNRFSRNSRGREE